MNILLCDTCGEADPQYSIKIDRGVEFFAPTEMNFCASCISDVVDSLNKFCNLSRSKIQDKFLDAKGNRLRHILELAEWFRKVDTRTYNTIHRIIKEKGLNTIVDLINLKKEELLSIQGVSKTTLDKIALTIKENFDLEMRW